MTAGRPHLTVDELLDAFIAAWHAGEAPSVAAFEARAAEADRAELVQLLGAFLQVAPSVEPSGPRGAELEGEPVVVRAAGLEAQWWEAREGAAVTLPWGERLRTLREGAGLSIGELGARFAERFALAEADAAAAPGVLSRFEAGALSVEGVAARAARALEELLGAARGSLDHGATPAVGGALLRGELPGDADERARLTELLRQVDAALPPAPVDEAAGLHRETLRGLLGVQPEG